MDAVDSMHFLDLCNDPVVRAGMKTEAEALDGNDSSLLTLIANTVYRHFPGEGSWPSKEGQWHTLSEAVSHLRELAMRVAAVTGHAGKLDDTPLTLSMRNAIIKNATSQYKGPVMAVLLGAEDWTIGGTVTKLQELGDLGEWDKIEKPRFTPNNGNASGNFGGGNQEGISRKQLWALLRQAGVSKEDMDGKPTSELIKMARKKGVVRGDPTQPVKPVPTQWNNPMWPVKKSDVSWRMTVDYRALNKHTPPLTSAIPDTISIIERIQSHEGEWYAVIDLANAFFTIPIPEDRQEQFAFTWNGRQYTFTRLPKGYLHSPTICHRIVAEHLDDVTCPPDVQISHYIDDILIQGSSQEVVQSELDKIISHMKETGWEVNPNKIQGPAQTVKFLGIQWNKGEREIVPKSKQKIMEFATPQTKIYVQKCIGLFGYWRHHIPHLSQIVSPLYKLTRKKYDFVWGPEQQTAFDLAKEAIRNGSYQVNGWSSRITGICITYVC